MKKRSFLISVSVLLLLLLWFCLHHWPEALSSAYVSTDRDNAEIPPGPVTLPARATLTSNNVEKNYDPTPSQLATNEESESATYSKLNDVRIVFYGKLQDQYGDPVADAEITGGIIYYNLSTSGVRNIMTTSDANGLFHLDGGKGEQLSIVPRKVGYAQASTNSSFKYSYFYPSVRHVPDPANPVVIEMWKQQGSEPLIYFQIDTWLPHDGSSSIFDLQTGRLVETGGDLIVQVKSPSNPNVGQQYTWKATIRPVDGGIIMVLGLRFGLMFNAPANGYEPEYSIEYQQGIKPWSTSHDGVYYLTSRGGKCFGKIALSITTDLVRSNAIPIALKGYINPAGSRNLEVDRTKVNVVAGRKYDVSGDEPLK